MSYVGSENPYMNKRNLFLGFEHNIFSDTSISQFRLKHVKMVIAVNFVIGCENAFLH